MSSSSVPVTGERVFEILESESPRVLKDASGDLIPLHAVRARKQGLADSRGRLRSKESAHSDLAELFARNRSQSSALPLRHETFTERHYPRSRERGPVEAMRCLTEDHPWGTSEARLFALLRRTVRAGDLLVGDRSFWAFANLALLPMRGANLLVSPVRRFGGRYAARIDWRKGQRLGQDDRLIIMRRPADKDASRVMSARL